MFSTSNRRIGWSLGFCLTLSSLFANSQLFAQSVYEIGYSIHQAHQYYWTHNYNANPAGCNIPGYLTCLVPTRYASGGVADAQGNDYGYWSGTITNTTDKHEFYLYIYGQANQFRSGLFTVGDISSFEYYTRKNNVSKLANWYLTFYTMVPGAGANAVNNRSDCLNYPSGNWYCRKLTVDLPYSKNYSMNNNEWTRFATDASTNQMAVYDGSAVNIGSYALYSAPVWSQINTTGFNWANYSGPTTNISYSTQYVLYMTLALGSGNTNTQADIDALKINFKDGSSYLFDFVGTTGSYPTLSGFSDIKANTDQDACTHSTTINVPSNIKDSYGTNSYQLTAQKYTDLSQKLVLGTGNEALTLNATSGKKFSVELINEGSQQALSLTRTGDENQIFTVSLATDQGGNITSTVQDIANLLLDEGGDIIESATAVSGSTVISQALTLSSSAVDLTGKTPTDLTISAGQIEGTLAFAKGSSAIVWTVTNTGTGTPTSHNSISKTQEIVIYDKQAPSFIALNDISVDNDQGLCSATISSGLTLSATDNCPGLTVSYQIDSGSLVESNNASGSFTVGSHTISWSAVDAEANTTQDSQAILVTDAEAPVLTRPAHLQVNNDTDQCLASIQSGLTATATDNCAGSVIKYTKDQEAQVTGNNAQGSFNVGTHTIAWTVVDAAGLSDSEDQAVVVVDAQAPVVTKSSHITVNNDTNQCYASIQEGLTASVSDNCAGATLSYQIDQGSAVNGSDAKGNYDVGVHTVKWTAIDTANLSDIKSQTVTVIDAQAPVLTIGSDILVSNDIDQCFATINSGLGASVSDNCAGASISYKVNGGVSINGTDASNTYAVGLHTITWEAIDTAGLSDQKNQAIDVRDTQAPALTIPNDIQGQNDATYCYQNITSNISASATDNCPGVIVSYRKNSGNSVSTNQSTANASGNYAVGVNTVAWTATDTAQLTDSATQTITITDQEKPVIQSIANRIVDANAALCSANIVFAIPSVTDNCGVQSFENDHNHTTNASDTYAMLSLQNGVKVSSADSTAGGLMTKLVTIQWSAVDIHGNSADTMAHTVTLRATDSDGDQLCNGDDNCPNAYNPSQSNIDGDSAGNACDCNDGYTYNSLTYSLNQSTYIKGSAANQSFSAGDATEKAINGYAEECDDANLDNSDSCTTTCKAGPKIQWVTIAGGTFNMGRNIAAALANEKPIINNVNIPNIYMAKHEVTVGQYRACINAGGCASFVATPNTTTKKCNWNIANREHYPMNCIDFPQAVAFSTWLGNNARLPNESEWTFAAHSRTTGRLYPWGAAVATCTLTHGANVVGTTLSYGCGLTDMVPVCTKGDLTVEGLCDMGGNVSEWVNDPYSATLTGTPLNGSARSSATFDARYITMKGASWRINKLSSHNYYRVSETPGRLRGLIDGYGFRPLKR